jgi:hypothetical protein
MSSRGKCVQLLFFQCNYQFELMSYDWSLFKWYCKTQIARKWFADVFRPTRIYLSVVSVCLCVCVCVCARVLFNRRVRNSLPFFCLNDEMFAKVSTPLLCWLANTKLQYFVREEETREVKLGGERRVKDYYSILWYICIMSVMFKKFVN